MFVHTQFSKKFVPVSWSLSATGRSLIFLLALLTVVMPKTSEAQSYTSQVTGLVKDTAGAIVPNAVLVATDTARGTSISSKSDDQGVYRFPSLLPSTYRISCTMPGFAPSSRRTSPFWSTRCCSSTSRWR